MNDLDVTAAAGKRTDVPRHDQQTIPPRRSNLIESERAGRRFLDSGWAALLTSTLILLITALAAFAGGTTMPTGT